MKIASQIQSVEASANTTATVSLDGAADFRDALAAAQSDTAPVHGAERKPEKSQTPGNQKKTELADSAIDILTIGLVPNPQAPIPCPERVTNSGSTETAIQSATASVAFPSLGDIPASEAPIAYDAQPLPDTNLAGNADLGAMTRDLQLAATPARSYENATSVDTQPRGISSIVLPDLPLLAELPTAAALPLELPHPSTLSPIRSADNSKTSGVATPSITSGAQDTPTPTAHTPSVVTASTIASSISLAGLDSNLDIGSEAKQPTRQSRDMDTDASKDAAFAQIAADATTQATSATPTVRELPDSGMSIQPVPPIMAGIGPTPKIAGANAKDTSTLQVASVSKSKPKSPSSEVRDSADDDKISAAEPTNVTEQIASLAKTLEATAAPDHSAGDPNSAINVASVQQPAPANLSAPGHSLQTTQIAASQTEARVPIASGAPPLDSPAMQGVTSAQLTQSMRSSEMKLGMQSAEFGNISITTSLNRQAISAQISIDHTELGRALAVHLPAMEEKLGSAYGVQAKVELRESYSPASSGDSGYSNSGQQSRDRRQSEQSGSMAPAGAIFERTTGLSRFTAPSLAANDSRLDIRI